MTSAAATTVPRGADVEPSLPPGSRLPALLQTLHFIHQPISFFERGRRHHGDCVSVRLVGYGKAVWICDPDVIRSIFTGDPKVFHAGEVASWMEPGLGPNSLVLLDEDVHLRHRRLLLPPLHGESIQQYAGIIKSVTEQEVATWPDDGPFALRPRMQRIALEVLLRAVFGIRDDTRLEELRKPLLRYNASFNWLAFGKWIRRDLGRRSPWAVFEQRRAAVDAVIYDEIRRRRAEAETETEKRSDVLALLIQAKDEDGNPMTDRELRDEMVTLLMAGHMTTATAMAWALHFLMRRDDAYARLTETLAEGDETYLDAVIQETLRLRPAVPVAARVLKQQVEINGYALPAGTLLAIPILLVHHLPELFPSPHSFRPERFIDGKPEQSHYIPYGRGIRRCIGASLADYELRLSLRTILESTTLAATSRKPEAPRGLGMPTVVPAKGAQARLVERRTVKPARELEGTPA